MMPLAAPLPLALVPLPLGAVTPRGWLRDQLEIQAAGLTGHLDEIWPDVGPDSGWLGGAGESWERGPYYCDGLVALAHILADARLLAKVEPFVRWMLGSQRADGFFGPASNDDWWPRMVAAKVLTQHAEATGDPAVGPFLQAYFHHQQAALPARPLRDWGQARAADGALSVLWLHARTQDPSLPALARLLLDQGIDWTALFARYPYTTAQTAFDHRIHVVNTAMALKHPGIRHRLSGDPADRQALDAGLEAIWRCHGQAHGLFSGDEWLGGTDPTRGTETCAVVEAMFSFEQLLSVFGDAAIADRLERIAYNALPACQSPDQWLHQYDQQVNQVRCTRERRPGWSNDETANLFGLEPNFGCCTANLHQGWPKFVAHLWAQAPDGALVAVAHGPSRARAQVGGQAVTVTEDTDYPFAGRITLTVGLERPARFALRLRIPGWCRGGRLAVAGDPAAPVDPGPGWQTIDRTWADGDRVVLELPLPVATEARPSGGVSVTRGPLVFVLGVPERWRRLGGTDPVPDCAVEPAGDWNYGIAQGTSFAIRTGPMPRQPFSPEGAPVHITASGHRLPDWGLAGPSAAPPPAPGASPPGPVEDIDLVPYGAARLRVGELPVVAPARPA